MKGKVLPLFAAMLLSGCVTAYTPPAPVIVGTSNTIIGKYGVTQTIGYTVTCDLTKSPVDGSVEIEAIGGLFTAANGKPLPHKAKVEAGGRQGPTSFTIGERKILNPLNEFLYQHCKPAREVYQKKAQEEAQKKRIAYESSPEGKAEIAKKKAERAAMAAKYNAKVKKADAECKRIAKSNFGYVRVARAVGTESCLIVDAYGRSALFNLD